MTVAPPEPNSAKACASPRGGPRRVLPSSVSTSSSWPPSPCSLLSLSASSPTTIRTIGAQPISIVLQHPSAATPVSLRRTTAHLRRVLRFYSAYPLFFGPDLPHIYRPAVAYSPLALPSLSAVP
ncbi:hypothetical protein OH77DRAFT_694784 [Trametes cingulata]|nr:hypothetical protein OH77DRAFT_694784 [Trametes cingulata]